MNLCCIKCLMFTKIKIFLKSEINRKHHLYSRRIDFNFKTFETIDEEELTDLLKV